MKSFMSGESMIIKKWINLMSSRSGKIWVTGFPIPISLSFLKKCHLCYKIHYHSIFISIHVPKESSIFQRKSYESTKN